MSFDINKKLNFHLFNFISSNIFNYSIFTVLSLTLAVSIWLFFPVSESGIHYYSIGLYILLVTGIAIFISYKKDLSLPLVKKVLEKEYQRVKFKHCKKNRKPIFAKIYLIILYYLILLFKNSQDSFSILQEDVFAEFSELIERTKKNKKGRALFARIYFRIFSFFSLLFKSSGDNFNLLKEETFLKFNEFVNGKESNEVENKFRIIRQTIDKIKKRERVDKDSLEELEKELFEFNKIKQKKATVFSLTAITALIITTVTAGLISSFLFPEVFRTRAASYGFIQTDWSGGVSALTGLHPGDQTNWNKYVSKDNVSTTTPGELSLDFETTEIWSQTSNADWQTHATSSTYYSGDSVGVLRPNGSICSVAMECSSGFCVDGYCCNTACSSACQSCSGSGTQGVCTGLTTNEDAGCTGVCTSCIAGTCTNRSAEDTTEGCATACYDCIAGSCSATTENEDGACNNVCTNCVAGACANRAADTQPSGCNSTCQYCNGAGSCKTCAWTYQSQLYQDQVPSGANKADCKTSTISAIAYGWNPSAYPPNGCSSAVPNLPGYYIRENKDSSGGNWAYRYNCLCN